MPKLENDRWEAFCHEYIKYFNGAQSYMAAYGTDNQASARAMASALLANLNIKQRISELKADRMETLRISAQDILKQHNDYRLANIADLFDENMNIKHVSEWPEVFQTMVTHVKVIHTEAGPVIELKLPDKLKNIELLGKHVDVQAYKDQVKTEHGFDDEVAVMMRDASKGDME